MPLNEERAKEIGLNPLEINRLKSLLDDGYLDEMEIEALILEGKSGTIEEEIIEADHERNQFHDQENGRVRE